eukprot:GILK01016499.1.p1 GENE.GILK01016499.1~~GILK01016499.1.p1  ORF type:complete len:926 (+),score=231.53 GILK01016499.1:2-2779(+)
METSASDFVSDISVDRLRGESTNGEQSEPSLDRTDSTSEEPSKPPLSLNDLALILNRLVAESRFESVHRFLQLFDPQNILQHYVRFHQCMVHSRFDVAQTHMETFVTARSKCRDSSNQVGTSELDYEPGLLGDIDWIQNIASKGVERLLETAPTVYEQSKLLSILAATTFSSAYDDLFHTFKLIEKTGIHADFRDRPLSILNLLIEHQMYSEAREYAQKMNLPSESIAFNQFVMLIQDFKNNFLWEVVEARMDLWRRCYELLLHHSYSSADAGDLLNRFSDEWEADLTAREQAVLASMALGFFQGTARREQPCRSTALLSEIRCRIQLIIHGSGAVSSWKREKGRYMEVSWADLSYPMLDQMDIFFYIPEHLPAMPLRYATAPAVAKSVENYLEKTIAELITTNRIDDAESICEHFRYVSKDVATVTAMRKIASKQRDAVIPEPLLRTITDQTVDLKNLEAADRLALLTSMTKACSALIRPSCLLILRTYQVASALNRPYVQVLEGDRYALLQALLAKGRPCYNICQNWMESGEFDPFIVATVLTDHFYELQLASIQTQGSPHMWSSAEFFDYVRLAMQPTVLGNCLVNAVNKRNYPVSIQVELIIMAYISYLDGCCYNGLKTILQLIRLKVDSIVNQGQFSLLIRLLTGVGEYKELQYLFDVLMSHNRFELIRQKSAESEGRSELESALVYYLQSCFAHDTQRLVSVYSTFHMRRDIAETLFVKADAMLNTFKPRTLSADLSEDLLIVQQLYLESADCFLKEECFQRAGKSLFYAALVGLQVKLLPAVRAINLDPLESRQFMQQHTRFSDALIVANAYDLNRMSEWVHAIYQQVVMHNRFEYFEDFIRYRPPSDTLFTQIAKRFMDDPRRSLYVVNLKLFLRKYLMNYNDRLKIITELGAAFRDVAVETAKILNDYAFLSQERS